MGHGSIRPRRGAHRKPFGVDLLGEGEQRQGHAGELTELRRPGRPWAPTTRRGATYPALGDGAALFAT
jgi:hypothetical protein